MDREIRHSFEVFGPAMGRFDSKPDFSLAEDDPVGPRTGPISRGLDVQERVSLPATAAGGCGGALSAVVSQLQNRFGMRPAG